MKLLQIHTFQDGPFWVAHFGEWDGATDSHNFYATGKNEQEAINELKQNADWDDIPSEAFNAFESDMESKYVHRIDWKHTFGEWLEQNSEVVG